MRPIPFSGRLDLDLACLLVVERHHALANRSVTTLDVATDVLDVLHLLEVDAADLGGLPEFDDAVAESLDHLVRAGWVRRRDYRGVVRYTAAPHGDDTLAWIRSRLADDPKLCHAFDALGAEVTEVVLLRYGESLRDEPAAAPPPAWS